MDTFDIRPGEERPGYLDHPSFHEPNKGPKKRGPYGKVLRSRHPSPDQIARRGAAIRSYYARVAFPRRRKRPPDAAESERSGPGTTAEPSDRSDGIEATPGPL